MGVYGEKRFEKTTLKKKDVEFITTKGVSRRKYKSRLGYVVPTKKMKKLKFIIEVRLQNVVSIRIGQTIRSLRKKITRELVDPRGQNGV